MRTGRLLQHYEPHGAAVNSLYFHPSGDYLASAADDATVCLLDLKEGRVCVRTHAFLPLAIDRRF